MQHVIIAKTANLTAVQHMVIGTLHMLDKAQKISAKLIVHRVIYFMKRGRIKCVRITPVHKLLH